MMKKIIFITLLTFTTITAQASCKIAVRFPHDKIMEMLRDLTINELTNSIFYSIKDLPDSDIGLDHFHNFIEYQDVFGNITKRKETIFRIYRGGKIIAESLPFKYKTGLDSYYIFSQAMQQDFVQKLNDLGCD